MLLQTLLDMDFPILHRPPVFIGCARPGSTAHDCIRGSLEVATRMVKTHGGAVITLAAEDRPVGFGMGYVGDIRMLLRISNS